MTFKRILVPVSGRYPPEDSENLGAPALAIGANIARLMDAEMDVLSVIGSEGPQMTGWVSWVPDHGMDEVLEALQRQGEICRRRARSSFDNLTTPTEQTCFFPGQ